MLEYHDMEQSDAYRLTDELLNRHRENAGPCPYCNGTGEAKGEINLDSLALECLEGLKKQKQFYFDQKHEFIKLPNGCKIFLRRDDIKNGDLDMYEIWLPDGEAFDGELFDPEIDEAIQKEISYHIIWK